MRSYELKDIEREDVSKTRAEGLAKVHRDSKKDPFPDIPPSLLSASDITRYVRATGLIGPFHLGGEKSRLKKASYEGRIGSCAFTFPDGSNKLENVLDSGNSDHSLLVKANSIVFVECDLDFRLPRNIALRFNLQIVHVHRGLLLGTGPLVDPGYWGKLCIPLHNLTDKDYEIPRHEGLIWVEFTKTTSDDDEGRVPLEEEQGEHWDISVFIRKAARQFNKSGPMIGIQSSIPSTAIQAETKAKEAASDASIAAAESSEAKKAAEAVRASIRNYGVGGALAAIVAVVSIWASFWFGNRTDIAAMVSRIDVLQTSMAVYKSQGGENLGPNAAQTEKLLKSVEALGFQVEQLKMENSYLRTQLSELKGK